MKLSRAAKRGLALAGAVLAVALALGFVRFKRFVDEDPRLCATCHRANPEFALWMGGSHKSVACQRCHHASSRQGVAMLGSFVAGRRPAGHAAVEVGACASCHMSHDPQWPQVWASRGHQVHYEQNGIACTRCHGANMHGFEPLAARCQECHGEHAVGVEAMHELHCFACHDFVSSTSELRPSRRDCLRCHTAQGIHAPMNEAREKMACASCHKPHRPAGRTLAACTECHDPAAVAKGGLHGARGHTRCLDCHKPHVWTPDATACLRCHGGAPAHANGHLCARCHLFEGAARPVPAAGDLP